MADTPSAYPLAWPPGWPRTASRQKAVYRTTLPAALRNLNREIRLLCGEAAARSLVLSSNATLGRVAPADPGVVAYVAWDGQQIAIPCDRWTLIEHNVQAIALTIEAMRAMERHGARHMIKAMFQGFAALPAPGDDWRSVLGNPRTIAEADAAFRELAARAHPDRGGSHDQMAALNNARKRAHDVLGKGATDG